MWSISSIKKVIGDHLIGTFLPFSVRAGGIPVFDAANLQQSAISAVEAVNQTLKQLEEYALKLQQYEDQIKNSLAPLHMCGSGAAHHEQNRRSSGSARFQYESSRRCEHVLTQVWKRVVISGQSLLRPGGGTKETVRRSWKLKNLALKLRNTPMTT